MPNNKPHPNTVTNPNGSSHLEIEPLDPRQGQPVDATIPHAYDQVLPNPNPGVQQPRISPLDLPDPDLRPILPKLVPGTYSSGSSGITKT